MIYTEKAVKASGPKNAKLMSIAMAPAKQELAEGIPFVGPSGRIFNDTLAACKIQRSQVFVTNISEHFLDDNDLYNVPTEILRNQLDRLFKEIEEVKPNCIIIQGAQTLSILMSYREIMLCQSEKLPARLVKQIASKWSITKWRGSILALNLPSGRIQKLVASMHPANFIRGQWKWLPIYKYIDVPRAVTQSLFPEMKLAPREAIVGPSFRQAVEFMTDMLQKDEVTIDYEGRDSITCLGVGSSPSQAICIPMSRVGSPSYWEPTEEAHIWKLWCQLLQNQRVKKNAQNAAFEWIKSWIYNIYPTPLGVDTMLAHHCLYPDFGGAADEWRQQKRNIDNPGHGLAFITSQYTDQPFYKDDGRHWETWMGEEVFWRYNALDVMVTHEAAVKMRDELRSKDLWRVYLNNYQAKLEPALRMEWEGTPIDVSLRDATRQESLARLDLIGRDLQDKIGQRVIVKQIKGAPIKNALNLASPKQVMEFIIKRGYKPRMKFDKRAGKSKATVDKDTLAQLAIKHSDPVLNQILEMRHIQDFITDVLDVELDPESKIHCHFKLGGTNGTRWSSTESILGGGTNLQNLPRQGPGRNLFIP